MQHLEYRSPLTPRDAFGEAWLGSAVGTESTLHQLSPYIGKVKSTIAASLIKAYTKPGDIVFDPFAGSGTVPMEAWALGRCCIGNDLSPYALLLLMAKLHPPETLQVALNNIEVAARSVSRRASGIVVQDIPHWVQSFFHPETLKEIITWVHVLKLRQDHFTLAALMGILHHQRPGFLSYPSSHTTPYLRTRAFPKEDFPELYDYRALHSRLEAKVHRAFRRLPNLNRNLARVVLSLDAQQIALPVTVDAIVTSPPYMRLLDYARDNRLRLWFLGQTDWKALDTRVSPRESTFLDMMDTCFSTWAKTLKKRGYCVLIVGDGFIRSKQQSLPSVLTSMALPHGFRCDRVHTESIPTDRRTRRNDTGAAKETVLVFRRVVTNAATL